MQSGVTHCRLSYKNIVKFVNWLQADLFICCLAEHIFCVWGAAADSLGPTGLSGYGSGLSPLAKSLWRSRVAETSGGGEFCRTGCHRRP
jgi:hypothetical protein